MLREEYLSVIENSDRIDPHWKNVLCISCHTSEPEKDHPNLRYNGIATYICLRCHNGHAAVAFVHPSGCPPSDQVNIPEDMPMENGWITCKTCHRSSLQEGGENLDSAGRLNPRFLRGNLRNRGEFCLKCHIQENFSKLNPHDQVSEGGETLEQSCVFCHFTRPITPVEKTEWHTRDPDGYCLVCHNSERYTASHPAGPHLVEPNRDILKNMDSMTRKTGLDLPLYGGRIACLTCHDPHSEGVVGTGSAKGFIDPVRRLRLGTMESTCSACHEEG
jgi:hypothetical protein